jgi:uncharacterized protein (TIGR02001 family)
MGSVTRLTTSNRRSASGVVVLCACGTLLAPCANAQDVWGGLLAVTSDYRVRGISQSRGEPAVQGGLHTRFNPGWFVGVWASTMDRSAGSSASSEVDAYVGFGWSFAPEWNAKLSLTHYWYPNDPANADYDYDELSASLAYRGQLIATVSWSPNTTYFGYGNERWQAAEGASSSYELIGLHPLTPSISLTAGVGYNDLRRMFGAGYWYWNAGLSCAMGPVQLDLTRIDSDAMAQELFGSTLTEAGWSAAISWRF